MENNNKDQVSKINGEDEKKIEFRQVKSYFLEIINDIIDLKKGVDKKATIEEIKNKKSLAGANAWMLMCSIMIASLGLDRNSPAVIIGAMLISPLMSPILGLGLGVGINDREVIKKSLTHFSVAILIAILTSTIYFVLTPLGDLTPEIEARTEPTILDVMIAFFGGVAGIISIARKDISTTIPGVAIATALMPPLCVTGYGIANWNLEIVLSSFYLFFSNTFFISLATYFIVRLLEFPYRRYLNKKDRRRNRAYVAVFSLLVIIPSFFIMRSVLQDISTNLKINEFIDQEFGEDRKYLEQYHTIQSDTLNELILKVYGSSLRRNLEPQFTELLSQKGLTDWKVTIIPTSEVNLDRVAKLETQVSDVGKVFSHIDSLENMQLQKDSDIQQLQNRIKAGMLDNEYFHNVCTSTKDEFPALEEIAIGTLPFETYGDTTITARKDVVICKWKKEVSAKDYPALEEKLKLYLKGKLDRKEITIIRS